ncbi:unnamed protein product [Arabidopsis lyrata]|nr:unnamed protein product [Arabidopsis lyrata]
MVSISSMAFPSSVTSMAFPSSVRRIFSSVSSSHNFSRMRSFSSVSVSSSVRSFSVRSFSSTNEELFAKEAEEKLAKEKDEELFAKEAEEKLAKEKDEELFEKEAEEKLAKEAKEAEKLATEAGKVEFAEISDRFTNLLKVHLTPPFTESDVNERINGYEFLYFLFELPSSKKLVEILMGEKSVQFFLDEVEQNDLAKKYWDLIEEKKAENWDLMKKAEEERKKKAEEERKKKAEEEKKKAEEELKGNDVAEEEQGGEEDDVAEK